MDNDIKREFDRLHSFLRENMVTRLEFGELSEKVEKIQVDVNTLKTSVDAYAKQSKDYYQEVTVAVGRVNRMERFLSEVVAPKIGVKYEI